MRRATDPSIEVLSSVKIIYFDTTDEFHDVQEHVEEMTAKYHLRYIRYNCMLLNIIFMVRQVPTFPSFAQVHTEMECKTWSTPMELKQCSWVFARAIHTQKTPNILPLPRRAGPSFCACIRYCCGIMAACGNFCDHVVFHIVRCTTRDTRPLGKRTTQFPILRSRLQSRQKNIGNIDRRTN